MLALIGLRYLLLLLVIPAYFAARSRRWWATMPLWLVCTCVMLTQFVMAQRGGAAVDDSFVYVGETTKIMLIPMVVQFVVLLRGMASGSSSQADRAPRKWIAALDAGERL
jgi:hypothetical protein